ncbi:SpvB/TcaC N-terminal domain-containing protein [Arthrobacter sp. ok909]|uniref:SpvB/TcaC N-terminal domain-containing protein n=1 Tax=Arthrobacter sp. ok909 TaxID=1761746 RepID=UPI001C3148B4|nr:SpvB/TcaC N-terminal domain-containing protein [Arthrobacter sp. ok909]
MSLPKGGGAIRGMGEKFAANPVSGTGSASVPIFTSPGRDGFGPTLSLSYDSGAGNGPFGFGWTLNTPRIQVSTDKRLPLYHPPAVQDAQDADVYLISGFEDLVPVLNSGGTRYITASADGRFTIHRYRPRVEGLFARIERWTRKNDGDTHWRSISPDNVLTVYGRDPESRIADPEHAERIFAWLICETRDRRGNAVAYDYKPEDGSGIDTAAAHQANRGGPLDNRRSANRYPKRIRYGNRSPLLEPDGARPLHLTPGQLDGAQWMFEVVFDYGEHDAAAPTTTGHGVWHPRPDAFSSYRSGFEIRTARLCRRVLMFHHFPGEEDVGADCLVRSTDFSYAAGHDPRSSPPQEAIPEVLGWHGPDYNYLRSVTQTGFVRRQNGYLRRPLPPLEFHYSEPVIDPRIHELDTDSLRNLPTGLDGENIWWTDLHGEGLPGILTERADAWYYKRNMGPVSSAGVGFAALERVASKPNIRLADGTAQFMDLAGDGQPDLAVLDGPNPGFYEHDGGEGWLPFRPFASHPNRRISDPRARLVDLNGDGHPDLLLTEDEALVWYPSLAEAGFGHPRRVPMDLNEERGPRLVFSNDRESAYLADMSGDGLVDLVRIRGEGEICYWPNLGHGRFGAKVTMDHTPRLADGGVFDPARVLLADIDGSGTTDLIFLDAVGPQVYFNQSGNGWSAVPVVLESLPPVHDLSTVVTADLKADGTACLVWSSSLPSEAARPMRYVNLMGTGKPHLLTRIVNNLGAETTVTYAPSTKFYLQDKRNGMPWATRLPFPVHVVERVETFDAISRNRFVTIYSYHHGYYDGGEREFRGFGRVDQRDTETYAALTPTGELPAAGELPGGGGPFEASNGDGATHVPPVLTRTWYHTGAYLDDAGLSARYAREYFGAPVAGGADRDREMAGWIDRELLPDTVLPPDELTFEEERQAVRALKGAVLRREVYAIDGTERQPIPYTVTEQNYGVRCLQRQGANRHAVFFIHPRETLTRDHERHTEDPRTGHAVTLEVDGFGNVLRSLAIAYGRGESPLGHESDRNKQTATFITYTHITTAALAPEEFPDDYLTPRTAEVRTYELTGFAPGTPDGPAAARGRFALADWTDDNGLGYPLLDGTPAIPYEQPPHPTKKQRRLIEHSRTIYRRDDFTGPLPLGEMQPLALTFEGYRLALTPGLVAAVYAGRTTDAMLGTDGRYAHNGGDADWWAPSGRIFRSPDADDLPEQERDYACRHFFLPLRFRNPFHTETTSTETSVTYDRHDLLVTLTRDPVGNQLAATNDYRVLQPRILTDPNGNRTAVAFDALGLVAGTAVMGKPLPAPVEGDNLEGFQPDPNTDTVREYLADPPTHSASILGQATTRVAYDLFAFYDSRSSPDPLPAVVSVLSRETHANDKPPLDRVKIRYSLSYSDGFGREIQRKVQAESGPVPQRGPDGKAAVDADGQPILSADIMAPRWVGTGWTVFNNKGKPVRQYEPFFTDRAGFEFDVRIGVSPVLFYDPVGRVIATLHPDHSYEKTVFDPWQRSIYDRNDTVAAAGSETGDPRTDPDLVAHARAFLTSLPADWQTWHGQRTAKPADDPEHVAARKAAAHANTPATVHLDTLGRPFLMLAHNGFDADHLPTRFATRIDLDIEGNQRTVRDAAAGPGHEQGRTVIRYDYDLLGNRLHEASMDAGERWMLGDVTGSPIRVWDNRGHVVRTDYDPLRRPLRTYLSSADPDHPAGELLTDRVIYGEQHPDAEQLNLRGHPWLQLDQAGAAGTEAVDFKGNPLGSTRRIAAEFRKAFGWAAIEAAVPADPSDQVDRAVLEAAIAPLLEAETYTSSTTYDALNRPITMTAPHAADTQPSTIRHDYNEAGLLEQVQARLSGETGGGQPVWTQFVNSIDYDARGRRRHIEYGNGASSSYGFDPWTFRLVHTLTRRVADRFPGDCPQPAHAGWPGCQIQNLHYTYDPVGNITHIRDDAQQAVFFRNRRVEPSNSYTYDALYRLVEATGREHLGQDGAPVPHSHDDAPRTGLPHPGDGNALGGYVESYDYDAVGNVLGMRHRGTDPNHAGWTRTFTYASDSPLEAGVPGNRLAGIRLGGNGATEQNFLYDAQGNMIRMPHLANPYPAPNMTWDHRNQLVRIQPGTGTVYYVYDGAGQRLRKVWEKSANLVEERIYIGGVEIYRRRQGAERLERHTLHIMDGVQRIALVETRVLDTAGNDHAPPRLVRYQLGNHLGSASLEVDEQAQIVSYEEYAPYGSTTYQAVRSQTETSKRYRFTGKERDEESGLSYHSARYYAPWLARWTSCDPSGLTDGINLYVYVHNDPIGLVDATGEQSTPPKESSMWTTFKTVVRVEADIWWTKTFPSGTPKILDTTHFTEVGYARQAFLAYTFNFPYEAPADPDELKEWKRGEDMAAMVAVVSSVGGRGGIGRPPQNSVRLVPATGGPAVAAPPAAAPIPVVAGLMATNQSAKASDSDKRAQIASSPSNKQPPAKSPGETPQQAEARLAITVDKFKKSGGEVTVLKGKVEDHHLVSNKTTKPDSAAHKSIEILKNARTDPLQTDLINDQANLLSLENHGGAHGENYHVAVYNRLSLAVKDLIPHTAAYRAAVLESLHDMKLDLIRKDSYLNSLTTRK